MNNSKMEV